MPWLASVPWPWRYMAPSIVPLMWCSCPVPLGEKQPPKHNVFTSMFDGGDGILGVMDCILPPPNTVSWVELMSKSWILVSSDHNTFTQNHWQFKALMISVLHGVVLPIVFLVTMVPAALRSLTRSSSVVLDWFLTVLMIIETPRCEILHGAPVQGRLTVMLCFFHLRIIAQTVVTFSPNC